MSPCKVLMTCLIFALLLVTAAPLVALDDTPSPAEIKKELLELREQFKERFKVLSSLKDASKVGETHDGLAGIVKIEYAKQKIDPKDEDSQTVKEFVDAENKDRKRLYELLAIQLKTTAEKVALRDGKRRFEKADKKEYLKPKDHDWITKEDLEKEEKEKESRG